MNSLKYKQSQALVIPVPFLHWRKKQKFDKWYVRVLWLNSTCSLWFIFSYHCPGTTTKTSPTGATLQQEPTIDPKYLPPLKTVTTTTGVGVATPGVGVKGEGHVGGVSPLVAAYLSDNQ